MYNIITASFITLQASVTSCCVLNVDAQYSTLGPGSELTCPPHHPSLAQPCPSVHLATRTAKKSHRLSCLLGLGQVACEQLPLKNMKIKKYFFFTKKSS